MENKEKEVLLKVRGARTYFPIKKGLMKRTVIVTQVKTARYRSMVPGGYFAGMPRRAIRDFGFC